MIFIHSGFRSGSTHVWSRFRQADRTVCYYEVFHELLASITPSDIARAKPDAWRSKHPPSAPYFLEFLSLIRAEGGIDGFDPTMSYQTFIPEQGCGGDITAAEAGFLARLVQEAESRDRIPVLTAVRSLGRVRGIKRALGGFHLLVYRNLFQQWCSFTDQAFHGNSYFMDRWSNVLDFNVHDKMLQQLRQLIPTEALRFNDPNSFYSFVFSHLHFYVQAAGSIDLTLDLTRLEADPLHRADIEQRIGSQNIAVDLSNTQNSIAYSLCCMGRLADVKERLKIIGAIVIGHAPDEVGSEFGAKVLRDLIEAYSRHEFEAAGLRSVVMGSGGLLADRDRLTGERQTALAERDQATADLQVAWMEAGVCQTECDRLRAERDELAAEFDQVRAMHNLAAGEIAGLKAAQDGAEMRAITLQAELDEAAVARDGLQVTLGQVATKRDAMATENLILQAERDEALTERSTVRAEHMAAMVENEALRLARDQEAAARDALRIDCQNLKAALSQAVTVHDTAANEQAGRDERERERLVAERDTMVDWVLADRPDPASVIERLRLWWAETGRFSSKEQHYWRRRANAASRAQQWLKASRGYHCYLHLVPNDGAIWIQFGHALKEAGQLRRALVAYEQSRKFISNDPDRDRHLEHLQARIEVVTAHSDDPANRDH